MPLPGNALIKFYDSIEDTFYARCCRIFHIPSPRDIYPCQGNGYTYYLRSVDMPIDDLKTCSTFSCSCFFAKFR